MYDIMRQAEEKLVQVGTDLTISVMFFVFSVIIIASLMFVILTLWNKNKTQKMSPVKVFLISLITGWAVTTIIFVYRMVAIAISKLTAG